MLKQLCDYVFTFLGMILISPLLLYIAYRIKKENPGPVIFAHTRIGKDGKPFPCFKFRSMVVNSQEMLQNIWQKILRHEQNGNVILS